MSAKRHDDELPAPPCYVPKSALEAAEARAAEAKPGPVDPWRILAWLLNAAAGIGLSIAIFVASQVWEVEARVIRLEQSSLTVQHGKEFTIELSRLKEELARLPQSLPPAWFVQRVDRLDASVQANAELFARRLDALQTDIKDLRDHLLARRE
jgi:hypothetical protein